MNTIYTFIILHPVAYSLIILILSGFLWMIIFYLCARVSDAECRLAHHTRQEDEHAQETESYRRWTGNE